MLKGSTYTGVTSITTNSVNTSASASPITISIDKSSKWVVTGDSTVSNLNVAKGAKVVDSKGKTVTTRDSNKVSSKIIDRTAFDKQFKTSTTYGSNA